MIPPCSFLSLGIINYVFALRNFNEVIKEMSGEGGKQVFGFSLFSVPLVVVIAYLSL